MRGKQSALWKNTAAMFVKRRRCRSGRVLSEDTIKEFARIDILVNNAAEQHLQESIEKITEKQLERTFHTNIFSFFFMTKAALKHLKKGATIINTASVTAYKGSAHLLDYSSTKGAIVSFTRSLSQALAEKGIRVNGVAPGPDLDTSDSFNLSFKRSRDVWLRHPTWPTRPA